MIVKELLKNPPENLEIAIDADDPRPKKFATHTKSYVTFLTKANSIQGCPNYSAYTSTACDDKWNYVESIGEESKPVETVRENILKNAALALLPDYMTDRELTIFTSLDGEDFYE